MLKYEVNKAAVEQNGIRKENKEKSLKKKIINSRNETY